MYSFPDHLDRRAMRMRSAIERTLQNKGRKVTRLSDHAIEVVDPANRAARWRVVVCRSGEVHFEPLSIYAGACPIPHLREHIADAFVPECDFVVRQLDNRVKRVEMVPQVVRALPPGD